MCVYYSVLNLIGVLQLYLNLYTNKRSGRVCDLSSRYSLGVGGKGAHAQTRAGLVILRLNELARVNSIHLKSVMTGAGELIANGFEIPQLFQESFLNPEDDSD